MVEPIFNIVTRVHDNNCVPLLLRHSLEEESESEEAEVRQTEWTRWVIMVEIELVQLLVSDKRGGIVLKLSVREGLAVVGMVEVARVVEWEEVATVVEQENLVTTAPSGLAGVRLNRQFVFFG